jgi:TM2 domain-containing membrane protein YozV
MLFRISPIYSISSLICYGSIFYGSYFLLKNALQRDLDILDTNSKSYNPSGELSDKEFLPTLLLCLFVGVLGVHRFYVGKIGTGIAMILTFGGLGIWVLIDFILICIGSFRDIEGRIVKYQRVMVNAEANNTGIAEELEKFAELKEKGIISEEEFNKKKEELL